jgi:hypothetical protein
VAIALKNMELGASFFSSRHSGEECSALAHTNTAPPQTSLAVMHRVTNSRQARWAERVAKTSSDYWTMLLGE